MGCCGHSRSRRAPAPVAIGSPLAPERSAIGSEEPAWPGSSAGPAAGRTGARAVQLRYRDRARVLVRGPLSGRSYEFSAAAPVQAVDARDAESLLRTRLFVRA
jgi:hypothetical protein